MAAPQGTLYYDKTNDQIYEYTGTGTSTTTTLIGDGKHGNGEFTVHPGAAGIFISDPTAQAPSTPTATAYNVFYAGFGFNSFFVANPNGVYQVVGTLVSQQ